MVGKIISDLPVDGAADISAELLKLTSNAGISFEISAAFSHLQKQQVHASKAHEYTRLEIDGVLKIILNWKISYVGPRDDIMLLSSSFPQLFLFFGVLPRSQRGASGIRMLDCQ